MVIGVIIFGRLFGYCCMKRQWYKWMDLSVCKGHMPGQRRRAAEEEEDWLRQRAEDEEERKMMKDIGLKKVLNNLARTSKNL